LLGGSIMSNEDEVRIFAKIFVI